MSRNSSVKWPSAAERSAIKYWGVWASGPKPGILPIGVLFFASVFFSGHMVGGKVWVLFFKPQRPYFVHIPFFLSSPTPVHPAPLHKKKPKMQAQGTNRGFKERERENEGTVNNGSRFLLQGERRNSRPEKTVFFDLVSFLVINLCLWCLLFLLLYSF